MPSLLGFKVNTGSRSSSGEETEVTHHTGTAQKFQNLISDGHTAAALGA